MNEKGFTLVEFLIVAMIIAVLTVLVSSSYINSRKLAQLQVETDEIVSILNGSRNEVRSGFRDDGKVVCIGLRFRKDSGVEVVRTSYLKNFEYPESDCRIEEGVQIDETKSFSEELYVEELYLNGVEAREVVVLFEPPNASIVFTENGSLEVDKFAQEMSVVLQIGSEEVTERFKRQILIDRITGRVEG